MEKTLIEQNPIANQHSLSGKTGKYDAAFGITGIILVALALRPSLVSIGPVLPQISKTFHLSHTTAGLLTTIPDLLMGLLALPAPWLARQLGRDKLIIGAMFLLTISTGARAYSSNTFVLMLTTAGVGIGIAITGTLLSGFVKANFASRAALVMGIYSTALALGSTVSAVTTGPISLATGSWRTAIGSYSAIGLLGTVAWLLLTRYHAGATANRPIKTASHSSLPWNKPTAWKIALFFACVNLLFYALLAWITAVYAESGLSVKSADSLLGYFTSAFMIGTPIISSLSKSHDRRVWLIGCSLLTLFGLIVMAAVPTWLPAAVAFLTALGLAGAFTLGMTLPLDNTISANETNSWTAFTLTIGYLIAGIGPLSVGLLRDFTGNFSASLVLLMSVALMMLAISFTLKPAIKANSI
jgi:CP family cyanate transporter-like MFS transporter